MMKLGKLREEVCTINKALLSSGLVTMHSGNASGRDPETGLVVIKPSGVDYDTLQPEDLVVVDNEGKIVEGKLKPSVDTPHHLFLYEKRPDFGGVIHTHSNYATSFAALGQSIPVYLTAIADEFGDEIPCTEFTSNEGDAIANAILKVMNRGPAVLLKNHGVFTFGPSPKAALKAAVMVEDIAKTVHLALQKGTPDILPPEEVKKWWNRYHSTYGQK